VGNDSLMLHFFSQIMQFFVNRCRSKVNMTTTVNTSLYSALRLNNDAVSLILAGQEREALSKLQQAVGMVKRNIMAHVHRSARKSRAPKLLSGNRSSEEINLPTLMTLDHFHQDSVQLSGLGNHQCYVYNRAFRVSAEQLTASNIEKTAQIGSAIIIFNMALILHRACLLHTRSVPASKSLALYNIVLQLVRSSSGSRTTVDPSFSLQGIAGAIQLAALNNTAQLQLEVGDYFHATREFGNLANLMSTIQQAPLEASEMRGVVMNILCFKKGPTFAPAA
jgi:hypothetical protein